MMRSRLPVVALETTGVVRRIPLLPHQLIEPITPQRDLFVLAHIGIPKIDPASWRLDIGGMVERPRQLTMTDIRGLPKRSVMSFHQCAGFPRRPDLATRRIGNVVWGGIDLAELLRTVGVRPEARFLWAYGLDRGEYDGEDCGHYAKDVPL
ncbi:MAG: molybdopterin-dependent oxidoreductase, partial [Bradyrhizobium sp.]